jgi:hypothetical protein
MPRVVRLGRAANDNARQPRLRAGLVVMGLAIALVVVVVLADGRLI